MECYGAAGSHRRRALQCVAEESHFTEVECVQQRLVPAAIEHQVYEAHFTDVFGKHQDQGAQAGFNWWTLASRLWTRSCNQNIHFVKLG